MKKLLSSFLLVATLFLVACERDATYDEFAACLTDEGFIFYGSFTCPHCHDQKELFEDSIDLIDYKECNAQAKESDREICEEAGIKSYPTWELPNGEQVVGVQSLEKLRDASSCALPGDSVLFQSTTSESQTFAPVE
jgi:glutaredoxin